MTHTNTLSRTLADVGLAAWFGGTLANAVSLNKAGAAASNGAAAAVADAGWKAWTPVNLAAIGAHAVGSAGVLAANKGRVAGQQGVASLSAVKTALLAVALGTTAYSRVLGQKVIAHPEQDAHDGTTPTERTDEGVAKAQQQLSVLQWAIPALTGALLVINARQGEQQRPTAVAGGILSRLTGSTN